MRLFVTYYALAATLLGEVITESMVVVEVPASVATSVTFKKVATQRSVDNPQWTHANDCMASIIYMIKNYYRLSPPRNTNINFLHAQTKLISWGSTQLGDGPTFWLIILCNSV